jgi:hypothetical protein
VLVHGPNREEIRGEWKYYWFSSPNTATMIRTRIKTVAILALMRDTIARKPELKSPLERPRNR